MKVVVLKIDYCDQCPFYQRVDENDTFCVICTQTKRILYDENNGKIGDGIPNDCPLDES